MKRFDFTGQIAKWGTQLKAFDIRYKLRNSVKGQVLADFMAEFSPKDEGEMVYHEECHLWTVFVEVPQVPWGLVPGL